MPNQLGFDRAEATHRDPDLAMSIGPVPPKAAAPEGHLLHGSPHGGTRPRVQTSADFPPADLPQFWPDSFFRQVPKAETLVVRPVPRDVSECRERDSGEPLVRGPRCSTIDKCPADASSRPGRAHRNLLDVRCVVDDVRDQVPDGHVVIVHGDPAAAELEIHAKFLDSWQIIVRHRVNVYGAEK